MAKIQKRHNRYKSRGATERRGAGPTGASSGSNGSGKSSGISVQGDRPARAEPGGKNPVDNARPKTGNKIQGPAGRSEKVIEFIEHLIIPSGIGAGSKFKLRDWQKAFIQDVYDPCDTDGKRIVRRAVLSVGRKNGKTALVAALVLVHLVGPEAEVNGEIYSAANERHQAAIVFKVAAQIVRADEDLSGLLKVVDSTHTIACYHNGSSYKAISAEAGSKHGLNPTLIIYDELAQARDRELYDVLDTSQGAREEPLFLTISTQNPNPDHVLSQIIDDGLSNNDPTTVTHLYEVPEDCENIFDESVWQQANPALGDFRSVEDMRAQARKAKRLPAFETAFRNLYLNQRIDSTAPLIPRREWADCGAKGNQLIAGESVFLGLDLSGSADLTALVAVSAEDGDRMAAWFWKPKDTIQEHETRDRAPYLYWANDGWIETAPGRSIKYEFVAGRIAQIAAEYKIVALAFDRWRIDYLLPHLADVGLEPRIDAGMEGLRMVPWGQGFRDMAPAIDALENSILERQLQHDNNPVLAYCFSNAQATTDPAGNRKLDKSKTRLRIDGAVATAMALGIKYREKAEADLNDFVYEALVL